MSTFFSWQLGAKRQASFPNLQVMNEWYFCFHITQCFFYKTVRDVLACYLDVIFRKEKMTVVQTYPEPYHIQHMTCTIQVQSVTPCGDFYEPFFFIMRVRLAAAAKQVIQ